MINTRNIATKSIESFLVSLVFCLISVGSNAAPGEQVFVPVHVGDLSVILPIMPAPNAVAIVEQTQVVGQSIHVITWQAVSNADYYQLDVTDEDGNTTSIVTTALSYALSSLPLGTSTVVLLACNDQDQCGAAANLGSFTANERIRYTVADVLGSPILETDQAGNVISEFHYTPFGQTEEEKREDIGFTGHLEDIDLGLTYMQARYYDSVLGRFYSNDPVSVLEHLNEAQGPQGFNRYAYVSNNPYKYSDPNGEAAKIAVSAGKIIYKAYKHYTKTGRLNKDDLRRIGGQELVEAGGDLYTIFGDPSSTIVDKVRAGVDLLTGLETNNKGTEAAEKAVKKVAQRFSPDTKVQDLLKGTGQIPALERNSKIKGVFTRELGNMTLKEVKETLTKKQFKTFMKHLEGRDLRHGK